VADHAHDSHAHGEHHGISHVASMKVLLGTWGALMVLTVVTVLATKVDLGSQGNLILAMFIAVVKATLVCTFFMHLKYDRPMHSIIIFAAILAGMLFVAFTLMDANQYQLDVVFKNDAISPTLMNEQLK
jgi:cytochrome c oxidase subunit 4